MMPLKIRTKDECRWDLVALGEVMLRLDPGEKRVHTARTFEVWEGGGEYNVARGLTRCFGMDTSIVTALADNPVGRLVEDLIRQGGVDLSHVNWVPYDGVGRAVRNGLNFTERGFGVRAGMGCSDRGNTAVSQLREGEIDWEKIFGTERARWFHTGGIFCALSETTPAVASEAIAVARGRGTIVSFDLNYRESLWKGYGGVERARELNGELARNVDVLIGSITDFTDRLGIDVGARVDHSDPDLGVVESVLRRTVEMFPNVSVAAATIRNAKSSSRHSWSAVCLSEGQFHRSAVFEDLEVLDRIGGGDSFAAGLIYGYLSGQTAQFAVDCGVAHGALAVTTPGDTSMATLNEVLRVMGGDSAQVSR
jgi:2-dehydro-3-deoxygluconokinase